MIKFNGNNTYLIRIGMIINSDYMRTNLIRQSKTFIENIFSSFKENIIDKEIRMANWVGNSILK